MEVTRANFKGVLPKVISSIDNADFIAIDTEMSGLRSSDSKPPNGYDTPKKYYEKLHQASKDFIVIQYGLCMFRYDVHTNAFKQEGYTFYISPTVTNNYVPDRTFLCQASSIDFLNQHNFDFNKMFKEGICYLNLEEQEKYKKALSEVQKLRTEQLQNSESANTNRFSVAAEDKETVDNILSKISEFLTSDEEERVLPNCNRFIRKLIYSEAPQKFKDKITLETRDVENSRDKLFVVMKWKGVEQRLNENAKNVAKENEDFENCVGFTKVIQHLVDSQKLVVGHNLMLDLFHTIDKFLTKLPSDYEQFKETAHQLFPNIIDTKQMCSSNKFKDLIASSVLVLMMDSLREEPFIIPTVEVEEDAQGYDLNNDKCHEAGYDAFLTGMCFLTMWNYLIVQYKKTALNYGVLEPFKNRLFLLRLFDSVHTYLAGVDPVISRSHVFYLKFPKQWKQSDIVKVFQDISSVSVAWIDSESAFVGLFKREETTRAIQRLCKSKNSTYQIMTYAKYQEQLSVSQSSTNRFSAFKRKICKSSDESEDEVVGLFENATDESESDAVVEKPLQTLTKKLKTNTDESTAIKRKLSENSSAKLTDESKDEDVVEKVSKVQRQPDRGKNSKVQHKNSWSSVSITKAKKVKTVPFEESSDWN